MRRIEIGLEPRRKKDKIKDETMLSEEEKMIEKLERLGKQLFIGTVCAVFGYVLLDTWRQVTVEQSKYIDQEG